MTLLVTVSTNILLLKQQTKTIFVWNKPRIESYHRCDEVRNRRL